MTAAAEAREASTARCESVCQLVQNESVAIDFEGADLCRHGELYLAQLAAADGPVVLVDVVRLRQSAMPLAPWTIQ